MRSDETALKGLPFRATAVPRMEVSKTGSKTGKARIGNRVFFDPARETIAARSVVAPAKQDAPRTRNRRITKLFPPDGGFIKNTYRG